VTAILGLVLLVVLFGVGAMFGYAILQPITKVDCLAKTQIRFYTCDFFTLSFLIAVPILVVTNVRQSLGENSIIVDVSGFILIGVFAYVWGRGATSLSSIGVVDTWKRCTYLGVLLPIAIVGSAIAIPMLIMMTFSLLQMTPLDICLWLTGIVVVLIVAILCRKCTMWVLSTAGESTGNADQ
jgi:hypothetical protein